MNPVAKSKLLYKYHKSKDVLNTIVRMRYVIKSDIRATKITKKKVSMTLQKDFGNRLKNLIQI